MSNADSLTAELKARAAQLGFTLAGACPAVSPAGLTRFHEWLAAGYAGEMRYLSDRAAAYAHPSHVLDGVRSLLMLGWNYRTAPPAPAPPGTGRIARYAWGAVDYHDLIHDRLHQLADFLRASRPGAKARGVVDSAPLLEREFAQLAGLGWIGKNTLLLNRRAGSWFFLAALLTDVELIYDMPLGVDHCGSCRACLDACPTQAFPQPYVLDATRCISYLTIEAKGLPASDLRAADAHSEFPGDWVFGCDICQEVCPWNRKPPASDEPGLRPSADSNPLVLAPLFSLTDDDFRRRFRKTPLWRPKRRGLLRNSALALGRQADLEPIPALIAGLNDVEPLVRGASAWALGRIVRRHSPRDTAAPEVAQAERLGNSQRINWTCGPESPEIKSDELSRAPVAGSRTNPEAPPPVTIPGGVAAAIEALAARLLAEDSPDVLAELRSALDRN